MADKQPIGGYNFCLRVDGVHDLACKSVHNFDYGNEYEYIKEGGLNDYVHIRRKPASRPHTLQVERYVGTETTDYLYIGKQFVLPVILFVSSKLNDFENAERTYVFTGCVVTDKTFGAVDAMQSSLITETVTIAYQQLVCVSK